MDRVRLWGQRGLAAAARFAPLLVVLLAGGCSNDPTGTYKGTYADGSQETIVIRPDGAFEQTLMLGSRVVYKNRGTWSLKGYTLRFEDFMVPFDGPRNIGGKTKFINGSSTNWDAQSDSLFFSEFDNYWLKRVSKSTPPPEPMDVEEVSRYRQKFRHPIR
jgi:hypothetical protein